MTHRLRSGSKDRAAWLEQRLAQTEVEAARLRAGRRLLPIARAREVDRLWSELAGDAWREACRETQRHQRAATRWREAETLAQSAVSSAGRVAAQPGMGIAATAALTRARGLLGAARDAASRAELDRATELAAASQREATQVSAGWRELARRFDEPELRRTWRSWAEAAIDDSRTSARVALVVSKLDRRLHVFVGGRRVATYGVELGADGLRRKLYAGDRATPEGRYRVVQRKGPGQTAFHRALLLDYPNREDRQRFSTEKRQGVVPDGAGIGGLIEIHGSGGRGVDWTDGCVALTDEDMDRLFEQTRGGAVVAIVGVHEMADLAGTETAVEAPVAPRRVPGGRDP